MPCVIPVPLGFRDSIDRVVNHVTELIHFNSFWTA